MAIINRPSSEVEVKQEEEVPGIISRPKIEAEDHSLFNDVELGKTGREAKSRQVAPI